jgi:hypothetical protein
MFIQNKKVAYSTEPVTTMLFVREDDPANTPDPAIAAAAEMERKIAEAVAAQVTGLKAKNDELIEKVKKANERVKLFDNLDPVKLKEMSDRLDHDEDLKLFAEGKKHEVIEKHTQRMRQAHADELKAKDDLIKLEAQRADAYKGSVLDSQILSVTGSLHKGAVEDALLHARNIFSLDAKGKAVQIGPDGVPVLGKDGTTPFGPAEWIEIQKETKPHWFPASTSGGGSGGARDAGTGGTGKTMKRSEFETLTPSKRAEVAIAGTQIVD